jgi:hypothetical protein
MRPLRIDTADLAKRATRLGELADTLSGQVGKPDSGQQCQESTVVIGKLFADAKTDRAVAAARMRATETTLTATGKAYTSTDGGAAGALGDQVT